jgi:K(+)-stimulated pyrophosphate-energized sodium pump
LIGLVIAPILGGHTEDAENHDTKTEMVMGMGKCDPAKMATMTKDECAKMCDEMGCTDAEKEMCMSHYDANGKFIAGSMAACCAPGAKMETMSKEVRIETTNTDGKVKSTVTTTVGNSVDTKVFEGTEAEVNAKLDSIRK